MLGEYPFLIFEKQHHIDNSGDEKIYCFYDLDYSVLSKFLPRIKNHEYEIRSEEGEVLKVNIPVDLSLLALLN